MKNVLFATTALVAMAGSAMAASHGNNIDLAWSGDFEIGYNDEVTGGSYAAASLGLDVTVDFGDSVTGAVGIDFATTGTTWTYVEFNYDAGNALSASLRYGDLLGAGASERYYSPADGMAVGVETHDGGNDVVAEVSFGSISVAAGCQVAANVCQGINVGAGATFGSIKLGLGYDSNELVAPLQRGVIAVSADATFGKFNVGVSYASGSAAAAIPPVFGPPPVPGVPAKLAETSLGLAVGGTFGAVEVGAYYAANSVAADAYGFTVDYSAGAMTVGAYYDAAAATSYGLDVAYDVSDSLTANAGYFNGSATVYTLGTPAATVGGYYYVGVDYAVNSNITATLSYATADAFGAPEYAQGISAFITASF